MKRIEHKIICTAAVGVPRGGEPDPNFEGGKVDADLEAGVNELGKQGWKWVQTLDNPPRMIFAREVEGPGCEAKACGNCRHWTTAREMKNRHGFGTCQQIIGSGPVYDRPAELAVLQTETPGSTLLRTRAEFGCFTWERRD